MRPWQIWLLVFVISGSILFPVSASESERYPGLPDTVKVSLTDAIDPGYITSEILGVSQGPFTSKILFTAEDFEAESNKASTFAQGGYPGADKVALVHNSFAIRKYEEGSFTSGEKDAALTRCYLRSADLLSRSSVEEDKKFAVDMYDRSLEYNRFNFDAWDGKIKLLESQGDTTAADEAREQKHEAEVDQAALAFRTRTFLPLPAYIVVGALLGAMLLMVKKKKLFKK